MKLLGPLLVFCGIASAQIAVMPDLSMDRPVPANLLRFYLKFPKAMARGRVAGKLHLLREDGSAVAMPFLDMELWDREQRTLTVLIDPGRVKRGVAPQQELGEVFEAGRRYTLVVDADVPDASGAPLGVGLRREFGVGLALRQGIDPNQWRVSARADAVTVDFDRTMDAEIADWALDVFDASGRVREGEVRIEQDGARWVFRPAKALEPGRYELRIDPAIEDPEGNRLGRPFDVDVAMRPASGVTTVLRFEIE